MTDNKPSKQAGSLKNSEPVFLAIGKLRRPHGLNGEISMEIYTDFPERLKPGIRVYLGDDHLPIKVKKIRWHQQYLLVTLDGFTQRETVGEFRNQIVYVAVADRPPLDDGEYYHHQLLGLSVIDESGKNLGKIADILETGANDVFIVRAESGMEFMLPYLDSLVIAVDLERGEYHTRLLPGLLSE